MAESSREQNFFNMTPVSRAVLAACGGSIAATAAPAAAIAAPAQTEQVGLTDEEVQKVKVREMAKAAKRNKR